MQHQPIELDDDPLPFQQEVDASDQPAVLVADINLGRRMEPNGIEQQASQGRGHAGCAADQATGARAVRPVDGQPGPTPAQRVDRSCYVDVVQRRAEDGQRHQRER
jgi:hypothetical protein